MSCDSRTRPRTLTAAGRVPPTDPAPSHMALKHPVINYNKHLLDSAPVGLVLGEQSGIESCPLAPYKTRYFLTAHDATRALGVV